jgi:hypothetical protein
MLGGDRKTKNPPDKGGFKMICAHINSFLPRLGERKMMVMCILCHIECKIKTASYGIKGILVNFIVYI